MIINKLLEQKNISKYRLSKNCDIPYTTLNDICSGKANLTKCSAETIYKIARELNVSMESILEPYMEKRNDFELFKSNVCHQLKELGDIEFIITTLESNDIRRLYEKEWYPESLYLLAMLDYISRVNNVPICTDYDDIRKCKLKSVIYPSSVLVSYMVSSNESVKKQAYNDSIPEFTRFNIIESEVRNIV